MKLAPKLTIDGQWLNDWAHPTVFAAVNQLRSMHYWISKGEPDKAARAARDTHYALRTALHWGVVKGLSMEPKRSLQKAA